jgi:hypothetical protein
MLSPEKLVSAEFHGKTPPPQPEPASTASKKKSDLWGKKT